MGGEIAWQALDCIAELVGIDDMELLIHGLTVIRDFKREQQEHKEKGT